MTNKVAAIQMVSTISLADNLREVQFQVECAVRAGAQLVVLPENFALFSSAAQRELGHANKTESGLLRKFLAELARENQVWLVGGTIPIADHPHDPRPYSCCVLLNPQGEELARYNKIHLFDVHVADRQGSYIESETYQPGDRVVVADTPFGRLGLAVCYDLRFPELFRLMFQRGVDIIALPSAFTQVTGSAHWLPLLRARAIENQCVVVAADQGGIHDAQRETFGHSCVINGWGEVLDCVEQGAGVAIGEVDLAELQALRSRMPVASHQRYRIAENAAD